MRSLRTAFTAAALSLLCAGYAASQITYFQGAFADYADRVDSAPVQRLAGFMLLAAIALAFVRDKSEEHLAQ
jgi:hypothetical protein